MTPEEFCVWLNGVFDAFDNSNALTISPNQIKMIKRKLKEIDYEQTYPYEMDDNGELHTLDVTHMNTIWTTDFACSIPTQQFNIEYTETIL
jgi:hypothetical protein